MPKGKESDTVTRVRQRQASRKNGQPIIDHRTFERLQQNNPQTGGQTTNNNKSYRQRNQPAEQAIRGKLFETSSNPKQPQTLLTQNCSQNQTTTSSNEDLEELQKQLQDLQSLQKNISNTPNNSNDENADTENEEPNHLPTPLTTWPDTMGQGLYERTKANVSITSSTQNHTVDAPTKEGMSDDYKIEFVERFIKLYKYQYKSEWFSSSNTQMRSSLKILEEQLKFYLDTPEQQQAKLTFYDTIEKHAKSKTLGFFSFSNRTHKVKEYLKHVKAWETSDDKRDQAVARYVEEFVKRYENSCFLPSFRQTGMAKFLKSKEINVNAANVEKADLSIKQQIFAQITNHAASKHRFFKLPTKTHQITQAMAADETLYKEFKYGYDFTCGPDKVDDPDDQHTKNNIADRDTLLDEMATCTI